MERVVPPEGLTRQCAAAADTAIETNRDLLVNRDAWKAAFCACAASKDRLVEWNIDRAPVPLKVCT